MSLLFSHLLPEAFHPFKEMTAFMPQAVCSALLALSPNTGLPFPSPGLGLNPTLEQVPQESGAFTIPRELRKQADLALEVIVILSQ